MLITMKQLVAALFACSAAALATPTLANAALEIRDAATVSAVAEKVAAE